MVYYVTPRENDSQQKEKKGGKKDYISYLDSPRYTKYLEDTNASVIIIDKDYNLK